MPSKPSRPSKRHKAVAPKSLKPGHTAKVVGGSKLPGKRMPPTVILGRGRPSTP